MILYLILTIAFLSIAATAKAASGLLVANYEDTIFANLPQAWDKWVDPAKSKDNFQTFPEPIRTIVQTLLRPLKDLFSFLTFIRTTSLIICGVFFCRYLMEYQGNQIAQLLLLYVVEISVFQFFYRKIFVKEERVRFFSRASRKKSSDPSVEPGILGNIFGNLFNIWKGIGFVAALAGSVVGFLWIGRAIDGRGGEQIHVLPEVVGWPEIGAIVLAIAIILFFVVLTIVNLRK